MSEEQKIPEGTGGTSSGSDDRAAIYAADGRTVHALVYRGVGPCEGCGKRDGSFRHATYKYVKDEERGVTVRIPQLWCSEECCAVCRGKKSGSGGRKAVVHA